MRPDNFTYLKLLHPCLNILIHLHHKPASPGRRCGAERACHQDGMTMVMSDGVEEEGGFPLLSLHNTKDLVTVKEMFVECK